MWFKNLQIYRFPAPWDVTPPKLEEQLARHPFRGAEGYDMQTTGWASPRENGQLVHSVNGQMLLLYGHEKKLLPSSVVKETVRARAAEAEARQGYKPGRKQLRDLKDDVVDELLPRAFNVRRNTMVWIDPANGWVVIDAGSPGKADEVISLLNKSVDYFTPERLITDSAPGTAMTAWLAAGDSPAGFSIDQDTELQSPLEEKATVRFVRHTLDTEEVQRHIGAGKQCTRLAMTWAGRVSFVLTESLTLKRVQPVDVIREGAEAAQSDEERFDSDMTMMTGELQRLIADLGEALGGVKQ